MNNSKIHLNIPVAYTGNILSWDDATIKKLLGQAIRVVVKTGLQLPDDHEGIFLNEAESRGLTVDSSARAVMFTESQVEETIAVMRKTTPVGTPVKNRVVSDEGRQERFCVGNGANLVFDWDDWQVKAPSGEDLVELCRWAEGCPEVGSLFPPVILKDIDQRLAPIYSYALMGKYCRKPIYHEQPTEPEHVRYLDKMARVVEARRGFYQEMQAWEYINPPFRLGKRSIETMLERVDSGVCRYMGIGSMTIAGMTAPVTIPGAAVSVVAEILAGLTFFRVLRPGLGLRACVACGRLDLRTAKVSYFGQRNWLQNLAAWDLLARGIGTDSGCLSWYRDANEPGMQAMYEFGTAQAFFSSVLNGASPEIGGLACGNIFSPEQAVLDMEIMKEFRELTYGFECPEDTQEMEEIITGRFDVNWHMSSEHTLDHMDEGVPFSPFLYRGLPAGAQHDKHNQQSMELMKKAAEAVKSAKAKGRQQEPDTELGRELYEYVKHAAEELDLEPPALL
jgi:trimethylamine:corrinoid methyltransferase-like protein